MSFALGLLVLWEFGVLPVPFDADAGPIARAAIAIGMAIVGAAFGFVIQWVFARIWGGGDS
jgi:hypothetical protein